MGANGGGCQLNSKGCSKKTDKKLDTYDWLCDIPEAQSMTDFVEVIFKNTRKGYFRNTNGLKLEKGDVVAVEATPGHDIGTVSLTGQLVLLQMKKNNVDPNKIEVKRIYRKARQNDIEKYEEAKAKEHETMLKSRKIAEDLNLNMKIGDVEYQGDGNKAIFYYIADERVDFRQLIKVLADTFKIRIEMRQIGARQEAGRIGGIGPCGRPLCCSSWMSSFVSVATSAARYQDISLNPQKLAGQCAKLKCCMNFEVDTYVEAQKEIPPRDIPLETKDGEFYHFKTDVFSKIMQYSSSPTMAANIVSIHADRVREIIALNKQGIKVDSLVGEGDSKEKRVDYENVVGQDSLTRFDRKKKKKKRGNGAAARQEAAPQAENVQDVQPESQEESRQPENRQNGGNRQRRNNGNGQRNNMRENRENRESRENGQGRQRQRPHNNGNGADAKEAVQNERREEGGEEQQASRQFRNNNNRRRRGPRPPRQNNGGNEGGQNA